MLDSKVCLKVILEWICMVETKTRHYEHTFVWKICQGCRVQCFPIWGTGVLWGPPPHPIPHFSKFYLSYFQWLLSNSFLPTSASSLPLSRPYRAGASSEHRGPQRWEACLGRRVHKQAAVWGERPVDRGQGTFGSGGMRRLRVDNTSQSGVPPRNSRCWQGEDAKGHFSVQAP